MKISTKILVSSLILFLLMGVQVEQIFNHPKWTNADSEITPETEIIMAYIEPPRKPFSLKNLVIDLQNVTSPTANDTDLDGLKDSIEAVIGTDPFNNDTDFDDLDDFYEVFNDLDPLNKDTNEDGLPDYYEITNVTPDFDGDGVVNAWDFDNDNDGVNDGVDLSPFGNSTIHSKFTFNVITDGKPITMNFQIIPENSEHLKLYYQTWDWPYDDEGAMQDLDNSSDDVEITPWLRITPNVLPDQEAVKDRGVIVKSDCMEISLSPTMDSGNIVAFNGMFYYPEAPPMTLTLEVELIWEITGNSDKIAKALLADNGKYVCVGSDGLLIANTSWVNYDNRSIFQWIKLDDDKIALKVPNGGFISVADNGTLITTSTDIGDRETFQISQNGNVTSFKAYNNKYLTINPDGVVMADSTSYTSFEVGDLGYYPDITHLVTYKEPFKLTGFNIEESYGCNLSLYYSEDKNQTIAADMLLTYDFIRNSTTTLADMPTIMAQYNISVLSQNQSYSDALEAYVSMSNEILPMVLDSLTENQIYPIIVATEEASKVLSLANLLEGNVSLGNSCTINLTNEVITITKTLKTDFYNSTNVLGYYRALSIEEILNEIINWNLQENATRTLMMMVMLWNMGEVKITRIGDVELNFKPPENTYREIIETTSSSLDCLSAIVDDVLNYQAYKALKFSYMKLAYKGGNAVLSNWKIYKIVRKTNFNVLKSLKINRMLGVIQSNSKFGKMTRFIMKGLQAIEKLGKVLDAVGILIGVGLSIWAAVELANAVGGRLGQELGAAYGIAGCIWAIVSGLILMAMFTNPFTAIIALIFIILDLIFDISSKVVEWLAKVIFGSPHDYHHDEPYLDIEGGPEPSFDDKDNNGLDVGDRIKILTHLVGGIRGYGENPIIEDRSYIIPWISIEPPRGTHSVTKDSGGYTSSSLLNQTKHGSTGGTTLVDKYDSMAWIEPGIGMINFPVKFKLNARYKLRNEWYHKPWWYFGAKCWHRNWETGKITPQEITTLRFDVLPGTLDDFLTWGEIRANDRDGDGLSDSQEVSAGTSNKLIYDTDADGLNDKYEIDIGTNPTSCDTDEDGLLDGYELVYGANATDKDSDDDGIYDFLEIAGWVISFNYSGHVFSTRVFSDPANNDTDGDGIDDGTEYWSGLNPRSIDTDGDGTVDVAVPPVELISILKNSTYIEQDILDSSSYTISEFAVDANGYVYIPVINNSDNTYFILKLDSNLTYYDNWSLAFRPGKIAVDNGNQWLYVENISVAGVSSFVRYFLNGTGPVGSLIGTGPQGVGGVDVDSNGFLYIARNTTTKIAQIEKYFPNGTLLATFGSYGTDPDQFTNLSAIAVDNKYGIIYAIDGHRVMKLNSSDGSFLTTLPNGYQNMVDIVTDVDGWVYVVDRFDPVLGEACVRKFDHNGMEDKNFILTNTSITPPWNIYHYPMRIAIDSNKNIYLLENMSLQDLGTRLMKFKENETQTPPLVANTKYDWDGDELWNLQEIVGWNTTFRCNPWVTLAVNSSPMLRDTDFDGLSDKQEFELKTHPWDPDTDKDGLSDLTELNLGTDPLNYDTDDDGLNDSIEILIGSNPINSSDTDGDGLSDLQEFQLGSNPAKIDTDNDGANDSREFMGNSNLLVPDTDNDFMLDGLEYDNNTDPLDPDTDDDYLLDGEELIYNTNPLLNDTDGDGAIDGMEIDLWLDPLCNDTDGDGLTDFIELEWGSNPYINDTDYDGVPDGMDLDIRTNFTEPIVLAYDLDPSNHTGEFAQDLGEVANVTIISVDELKANYTKSPYIVLVGKPAPENDTVGGLIYELLADTGSELAEMMKNDSHYVAVRYGIWTNPQTVVMLPQAYYLDVGKVISTLKGKNVTISQDSCTVVYQTAPIMHSNDTFYYGVKVDEIDTVKATDTVVSIILENWSLPIIQIHKYTPYTTHHHLNLFNGLKFGEKPVGKSIKIDAFANGTVLDKFQEAWIIIYYRLSDLDTNGDGKASNPWDINENTLSLYYFNETTGKWIKITKDLDWVLDMGINTTDFEVYGESYAGYIWIRTKHLSLFSIGGSQNIPLWDLIFFFILIALYIAVAALVIIERKPKPLMDNIKWELQEKKLLIKFDITKEYGKSSSGKTIIVANSHGSKHLKGTELFLGMIAYKYPEKKKVKPKKRREMQNIDITLDDNTVTLSIDTEKDFGPSSTGKSIIVASSRGNRLIEGTDVYVGINIFKKRKTSPKKKIDQIKAKPAITKPKKTKPITEEPVKSPEPKPSITESKKDKAKPIAEEPAKSPEPKPSITESKKKKDKSSTEKLAESPESESLIKNEKSPKFKLEDIRGLGPSKIKLLNSCGIYTIEDLINCDPNIVANKVRGLGIKSLKKWIQSAKELSLE